jgi:hypothetical protein
LENWLKNCKCRKITNNKTWLNSKNEFEREEKIFLPVFFGCGIIKFGISIIVSGLIGNLSSLNPAYVKSPSNVIKRANNFSDSSFIHSFSSLFKAKEEEKKNFLFINLFHK